MRADRSRWQGWFFAFAASLGPGCGDDNSGGVGHNTIVVPADNPDNVVGVSVDFGIPKAAQINGLFGSVTVCVPGTSTCQTIDDVLIDTGSSGLRVLASALTLSLPAVTDSGGTPLGECGQFISGFTWGSLHSADIKLANEKAPGVSVQVIGDSTYAVPNDCTGTNFSTITDLRANGILGISSILQDCGADCEEAPGVKSANPGCYYACASTAAGGCQATTMPRDKQLSNPVYFFANDNNGTIIELPAIPDEGAPQVLGSLVFGIGTRTNNGLGRATVLGLSPLATLWTRYPNNTNLIGFIDSGSNALSFDDSTIPICTQNPFYCPRSTAHLSARIQDFDVKTTVNVNFGVANANALFANGFHFAYSNLAGPMSDPSTGDMSMFFDWGLPFYFGRNVFTAIEGQATPGGQGPFVAF